jgi:LysR family glycine cleavage system transcriptional activator
LPLTDAAARVTSFTRAAQELFLTQSAESQKIQLLEQHLGYLVFHRTPAGYA